MRRCTQCHLNPATCVIASVFGLQFFCSNCILKKSQLYNSFTPNPFLQPPPEAEAAIERLKLESWAALPSPEHGR
jgi:hypothetical protein